MSQKSVKKNFKLYQAFMCSIFKIILGQNVSKLDKKKFKLYQVFMY